MPYEVLGDFLDTYKDAEEYMLLCGSCNRAKSWSCENCKNGQIEKNPEICKTCYWANPIVYTHIALRLIRRLDVVWNEGEVRVYEKLKKEARTSDVSMPEYVKKILSRVLK